MKKFALLFFSLLLFCPILIAQSETGDYILVAWNDLGMHCMNKDFSSIAILPPYNNLRAQVLYTGNDEREPSVITQGLRVTYEIPGNTSSVNKTNFWSYVRKLLGVTLEDDIGLTGAGLSGDMLKKDNHFYIDGIPITPFTDLSPNTEDPYQLALLKLYDNNGNLLKTTRTVIPVSTEISCVSSGCHSSEADIIEEHEDEDEGGFDKSDLPVLCASCHSSNALGTPGRPGLESLSFVIHEKHAEKTNDCYKCHPGQKTKCFRDIMSMKGLTCSRCHGDVANVAESIEEGRRPWLDEPRCGDEDCHGSNFSEEQGKLFRESRGFVGIYCSACHGSPHAIYPTSNERDNRQMIDIQGREGTFRSCFRCHNHTPLGKGPHGFRASDIDAVSDVKPTRSELMQNYPNPFTNNTNITFRIAKPAKVRLEVINPRGELWGILVNDYLTTGEYIVPIINTGDLVSGTYIYRLRVGETILTKKMVFVK